MTTEHEPQDDLARAAAAIDAEAAGASGIPGAEQPEREPQQVIIDHAGEARALIDFFAESLIPFYPTLAKVYQDDTRARMASALAPLMAKYNFTLDGVLGRWWPEINAAIVCGPVLLQTWREIRNQKQDQASEAARAEPLQPNVPPNAPA